MELDEIYSKLQKLNIPVAYLQFASPQKLPFVVFYEIAGFVEGADSLNLYRRKHIAVELYTKQKCVELERMLESLFHDTELERQADVYVDNDGQKMLMTAYTFETIQAIED